MYSETNFRRLQYLLFAFLSISGGSLTISRLNPSTDSGFYACYVMNREGETARREIQLVVNSPPILEPFSFPTSLQEGGRAQVTCYVTSGDMPIHFAWSKDGEPISAALQVRWLLFFCLYLASNDKCEFHSLPFDSSSLAAFKWTITSVWGWNWILGKNTYYSSIRCFPIKSKGYWIAHYLVLRYSRKHLIK